MTSSKRCVMRLLTLDNGKIVFVDNPGSDGKIVPYAILSHTWVEGEEILFDDIQGGLNINKKKESGLCKVKHTMCKAKKESFQYCWIDTCCIREDPIERSAAISSMFQWYADAEVCYAYLADVEALNDEQIRKSRWFTRGWTLQELLAPKKMKFFSKNWEFLGDKETLQDLLHQITGIPIDAICKTKDLSNFSVVERFVWGANRVTKLKEDQVFCLLGIFGVDFGLSYTGQGRAFAQLLGRIDESQQAQYDWDIWPSWESALGGHMEMFQYQNPKIPEITDDPILGPLVKLIQIAVYLMEHAKLLDVEELLKHGLVLAEKLQKEGKLQGPALGLYTRFLYSRLGNVYRELGDDRAAEEMYRKAMENPSGAQDDESFIYETHNNLGCIYADSGKKDDAKHHLEAAVNGRRKLADRKDAPIMTVIWLVRSLNNLGLFRHLIQKDFCGAETIFKEALSKFEEDETLRPAFRLEELEIQANMGRLYLEMAMQKSNQAETAFRNAISAWNPAGVGAGALTKRQAVHPKYLLAVYGLGTVHHHLGKDADAIEQFTEAFSGHKATGHIDICQSADALARCHTNRGEFDKALCALREGLEVMGQYHSARQEHIDQLKELEGHIMARAERENLKKSCSDHGGNANTI